MVFSLICTGLGLNPPSKYLPLYPCYLSTPENENKKRPASFSTKKETGLNIKPEHKKESKKITKSFTVNSLLSVKENNYFSNSLKRSGTLTHVF